MTIKNEGDKHNKFAGSANVRTCCDWTFLSAIELFERVLASGGWRESGFELVSDFTAEDNVTDDVRSRLMPAKLMLCCCIFIIGQSLKKKQGV